MANKKSKKKKPSQNSQKNTAAKVELEKTEPAESEDTAEESSSAETKAVTKSSKDKGSSKNSSKSKKANPVAKYFRDLRSEFKKVVWPARQTVINNTGIVLATMAITGAGVFALDLVFAELFKLLLGLAGG